VRPSTATAGSSSDNEDIVIRLKYRG